MQNISFQFNIDRGGTFTDFYVQKYEGDVKTSETIFKHLSSRSSKEGPIQGIKLFLKNKLDVNYQKIPVEYIKRINMGTTLSTNALLEKKGEKNAMILTKGFEDLLSIRNQTRPNIFDLSCQRPLPLYTQSYGIDERILFYEYPDHKPIEVVTMDSIHKIYVKEPRTQELREVAEKLKERGIESIGIAFAHSYLYDNNEKIAAQYFREQGFKNVYVSSERNTIGYLNRAETVNLQAFLNPYLDMYFNKFRNQFDQPDKLTLRLMKSDGGFTRNFLKASESLLSGPAGGLVGYSYLLPRISELFPQYQNLKNAIGLDMGGTSTDVSKFNGKQFEHIYNFEINSVEVNTPHLQIDTIAAGGGSKLNFFNGIFKVGPHSVGADPGPMCYGLGNELAITDANLVLNRLDLDSFPKNFGKDGNEGLNKLRSIQGFTSMQKLVNEEAEVEKSIEQIALGFIQVSNEMMARSVRKLYSTGSPDVLIVFGSAGGQHACGIADQLGIKLVYIHKYSGVLSAYGLSKSSIIKERKKYIGWKFNASVEFESFAQIYQKCYQEMYQEIKNEQKDMTEIETNVQRQFGIKYQGTDYPIIVKFNSSFKNEFERKHMEEFGFVLENKEVRLEFIRIRVTYSTLEKQNREVIQSFEDSAKFLLSEKNVYFQEGYIPTKFYSISEIKNTEINGPAILVSATSSIVVQKNWNAKIRNQNVILEKCKTIELVQQENDLSKCDPITLSLYSSRLLAIAQQMGKSLQRTSISTNIKERLDFSCAIFDNEGKLIVNAPHLPVHLGSMQTTVIQQIKHGFQQDQVILTNHPQWGGSHLPDLTVITRISVDGVIFYLASRGHHADIGGISPGSMPAFSKSLSEQGVAIGKFVIVKNGVLRELQLRELFRESRRIQDNVSDLKAQISANSMGVLLIKRLIEERGPKEVLAYMKHITLNAEKAVRNMLTAFSIKNNYPDIHTLQEIQYMDDGTKLSLNLTIDKTKGQAIFDFTGTGCEVYGNTNAPESITKSAILYCLRSLIKQQIPLNSGCLNPIKIIIPAASILSPSENSAVVGGNVETSQRLVDLILKPFRYVSASQGTMNNFLFGNKTLSYYETISGGTGAGSGFNGTTCQCHMTNTRITDLQILQTRYPVSLVQFKKRQGSGGRGKWTGGDGIIREYLFFQQLIVSVLSQRRVSEPYGLFGGQNGKQGRNIIIKNGIKRIMPSKSEAMIEPLDRVIIETPGGGGYEKQ